LLLLLFPSFLTFQAFVSFRFRSCLVGDPQQLPATIFDISGRNSKYDRSLFQRLEEAGQVRGQRRRRSVVWILRARVGFRHLALVSCHSELTSFLSSHFLIALSFSFTLARLHVE
jgi:hypothetical protein